jgi:hypothetical protein
MMRYALNRKAAIAENKRITIFVAEGASMMMFYVL